MARFLFSRSWVAALLLALVAAPLAAELQPAVQPGGDIPRDFRPITLPPAPPAPQRPANVGSDAVQYIRREAMVPMRDGVRLYTALVLPRNARNAPIILDRTPYSARKATARGVGPWPESILSPIYAELVRAGYIVAVQDVRGKYESGGDYVMNRPLRGPLNATGVDHSTDAWDSIDWLVGHVPESNGRVATMGISYDGFTALMSLVDPHPALKASVPINPMVDVWKGDDWFHNGAFRQEMASYVYNQTAAKTSDDSWFTAGRDDYNRFLRLGSAAAYGRAMGLDQLPFWRRLLQHPAYDEYWQAQALDRILARRPLTVPTLLVGGLWDQEDAYGTTAAFAAIKGSGKAWLALGPWHHGQVNGPAMSLGPMDWGSDTARWFRVHVLIPFLDHQLKGGPDPKIARATVFDAGPNVWRRLADWPQACISGCATGVTPLYPLGQGRLGFAPPSSAGSDAYVSDPARPVPYRARAELSPWAPGSTWRMWLVDDQRFAEARADVLTYVGAPLDKPLHLSGTPFVHLVASTSGTDSDWVVKLIDVYPDRNPAQPALAGYRLAIAMDILRGRYRDDPALPSAIPAGRPLTYGFQLPAVSYTVQPGHRLMIQVQSTWFPLYDRNPQSYVPNIFYARPADFRAATQRVFTGPGGTWIGLPIVR